MTASTVAPEAVLIDIRECARRMGISTRTLWTLTARGELPAVRINRRVLYRVTSLHEFAERRERGEQ